MKSKQVKLKAKITSNLQGTTVKKKKPKGLQIEQVPIANLVPYPNNAKSHPETQIAKIAGSIKEFGFVVPILIDKSNGIITGHGRLEAAKLLKMAEVPCLRAEGLTKAQIKAFRIADNKVAESYWLDDLLKIEIEGLKELDFNIDLLGFEDWEFLNYEIPSDNKDIDEDAMSKTDNECPNCGFQW